MTAWGGRALEWHSRGQRFDPAYLHQDKTWNKSSGSFLFCILAGAAIGQRAVCPHNSVLTAKKSHATIMPDKAVKRTSRYLEMLQRIPAAEKGCRNSYFVLQRAGSGRRTKPPWGVE